ncbi:fatty acyl-AMP ligase [Paraburkholderia sp. Tr-20389]|uniref:fatty acyl-AMP ligase n=1 Tax=Paraburkholderia sp. Tr-20389 TaxID=2703903 RepID=UPI0019826BB7|nr:fatty acyl-AMP ligase [Paraburkholderia sp. Tr-20389]MBN3758349.1 fatty acyl-AMP ligase [Paraburkholderia sp. Tr-20389]
MTNTLLKELFPVTRTIDASPPLAEATTMAGVLRWRAVHRPDDPAFHYLGFGREENLALDYRSFDRRASAVAVLLRAHGVKTGDRALLLYPSPRDFLPAFFGCLYAGCVAVPAPMPEDAKEQRRLAGMIENASPKLVLCRAADMDLLRGHLCASTEDGLPLVPTDVSIDVPEHTQPTDRDIDAIPADTLAFLQYTSGSTAAPKGAMVTHRNIMHNEEAIRRNTGVSEGRCLILTWLPYFHDMGLIGCLLLAIYSGRPAILMSTTSFLQQPMRWLRLMSDCGVTHSCAPNFAYDLCVRRGKRPGMDPLDLSAWRVAFSGAEPVRYDTLMRFAEQFADAGFSRDAFMPGYGLAENTLFVTSKREGTPLVTQTADYAGLTQNRFVPAEPGHRSVILVSCGRTAGGMQSVMICDPQDGNVLPAGHVGEICVQGESSVQGYFGANGEDAAQLRAYVDRFGGNGVLRTGDLGFVDAASELYITGRVKDLLICNGGNHYPQDVEFEIEQASTRVRQGRTAAFAVNVAGQPHICAVCEVDDPDGQQEALREQAEQIVEAVRKNCSVLLSALVLVRKGTISRTTSGKIQRADCRERYLRGALPVVYERVTPGWEEASLKLRGQAVDAADEGALVV